jgi:hypothetical protein
MKTYIYRDHRIDLHPYAGGYKAFIFAPGSNGSGSATVVAAPDGQEAAALDRVLRDARMIVDGHSMRRAA